MAASSARPLFDAPQAVDFSRTPFVPTVSTPRRAEGGSRRRVAAPKGLALMRLSTAVRCLQGSRSSSSFLNIVVRAVFRLAGRICVADGALLLLAALCALVGLPAALTAFLLAVAGLMFNCWVAVGVWAPVVRRLIQRRR